MNPRCAGSFPADRKPKALPFVEGPWSFWLEGAGYCTVSVTVVVWVSVPEVPVTVTV